MITFTIIASGGDEFQWNQNYRLFYILNGTVQFDALSEHFTLSGDQMVLFNPYDMYAVRIHADSALLQVDISTQDLDAGMAGRIPRFLCNSHCVDNADGFMRMRQTLARLLKISNDGGDYTGLELKSQLYHLFYILSCYFPGAAETSGSKPRIIEILNYLNNHCCERVTLQSTADTFYLSTAYLSRLFRQELGVSFTEYLNSIRVSRSMAALESGGLKLVQIAEQYGFANTRAYNAAFIEKHGVSPTEYRRMVKERSRKPLQQVNLSSNYLSGLAKYLDMEHAVNPEASSALTTIVRLPDTDASQKGTAFGNCYRKLTAIGRASQLLNANDQAVLREVQREIGFEYIVFHGLLDDDMMVYHETADGKEAYNFSYIDAVFDFLLEIGLKPFIQLSFMPGKLAAKNDRITFLSLSIISLPKSMAKWNRLIASLFRHLIVRYGLSLVREWPVYIWNLPDNPRFVFGIPDKQSFFDFYSETFRTIKSVCPDIGIGTPSVLCETVYQKGWLDEFMQHCHQQDTVPEFLCVHAFAVESADKSKVLSGVEGLVKSTDPNFIKNQLSNVRRALKTKPYRFTQIYVTEWNLTIVREGMPELLMDMAFKAAYIVKNLLDNYDIVNSLCHWTFTDSLREVWDSGRTFNGGNGLITYNGIKKSAYYAFVLISALRPQVINRGEGFIVTRCEKGTYAIILYHYQHFSQLYASGEMFDMTDTNRYTPFDASKAKRYEMSLKCLAESQYVMTETILNRQHGSAFDKWLEYSQIQTMSAEDKEFLQVASIPWKRKKLVSVSGQTLSLSLKLESHEVRLIELIPYSGE